MNVRVHNNRITCGFAYFDAGLPESVVVKSGNSSYSIRIPDTIQKARTYTLLTSPADAIEFQVVAN